VNQRLDAVVAGHLCLDVIPDMSGISGEAFQERFLPGRLLEVGAVTFCTGGAVANTGLALARLGVETRLMGKLGDDLFGRAVNDIVSSYGPRLGDHMIVDAAADTSYTVIVNPADVDRAFLHHPGANASFCADDVRFEVIRDARLFHFGYPPLLERMYENRGAQLVDVFRSVKELGVTTSLDMAVFDPASAAGRADWVAILGAVMPYVDIFVPNIEETLFTLRRDIYDDLVKQAGGPEILPQVTPRLLSDMGQQVLEMGAKIVGLKLGDRGFYLCTAAAADIEALGAARPSDAFDWADKELWVPCFRVGVRGTTGAGDATVAGFLSALLRDLSPEKAVTAAVAVGACNVEAADALSGLRPWDDTWRRVDSGWPRRKLSLDEDGWRFDRAHQLWVGPGTKR
jgi:sugar/nucleoside kinase (ribokinase family)